MGRKQTKETKAKISKALKICPFDKDEHEGLYAVYYLPEEHYVGTSRRVYDAYFRHKNRENRNVEGMRILSVHPTKEEARHRENLWHSYLGCNGIHVGS